MRDKKVQNLFSRQLKDQDKQEQCHNSFYISKIDLCSQETNTVI